MPMAIRIHSHGGPEVMTWEEVAVGDPGPGQVRLRHTAVGLNYIDTYHRTGLYPVGDLPAILGQEAAGVVEAVGEGITTLQPGDRVATCNRRVGRLCHSPGRRRRQAGEAPGPTSPTSRPPR